MAVDIVAPSPKLAPVIFKYSAPSFSPGMEARSQLQSPALMRPALQGGYTGATLAPALGGAVSWHYLLSLSLLSTLVEKLENSFVNDPYPFAWAPAPWVLPERQPWHMGGSLRAPPLGGAQGLGRWMAVQDA